MIFILQTGVYKSNPARPHGFAIVVNIKDVPLYAPRHGSEKDVEMINNVFKQLHYDVLTLQNLGSQVCVCILSPQSAVRLRAIAINQSVCPFVCEHFRYSCSSAALLCEAFVQEL